MIKVATKTSPSGGRATRAASKRLEAAAAAAAANNWMLPALVSER